MYRQVQSFYQWELISEDIFGGWGEIKTHQVLKSGIVYHIYNRGNNGETIFPEERNYGYFLQLYEKYISSIADTFAYCLMPNHFIF